MLIGCGLRRGKLLALRVESIQQREEHWVVADLIGKGRPCTHRSDPNVGEDGRGCVDGVGRYHQRAGLSSDQQVGARMGRRHVA
jgi:hypothetical protein